VIFTSGASEALAIALGRAKGGARYVSAVEHDAVFRAAPAAVRLPVDGAGRVLTDAIAGERPVVAVQHVNNETGIVQPLAEIAAEVRARGGLLVAIVPRAAASSRCQTPTSLPCPRTNSAARLVSELCLFVIRQISKRSVVRNKVIGQEPRTARDPSHGRCTRTRRGLDCGSR
jgi:hypothetical protein